MICRIVALPPNGICSSASLESCTSRKAPPAVCNLWPPVEHLQHFNFLNSSITITLFPSTWLHDGWKTGCITAGRFSRSLFCPGLRKILLKLASFASSLVPLWKYKIQNSKYKHTLEVGIICTIYCAALECGLLKSWKVVHTVRTMHSAQCLKGRELLKKCKKCILPGW